MPATVLNYRTNSTTTNAFIVDPRNQLTNALSFPLSYDSNGNLTNQVWVALPQFGGHGVCKRAREHSLVDDLNLTISNPPTQLQVQSIALRLYELILALKRTVPEWGVATRGVPLPRLTTETALPRSLLPWVSTLNPRQTSFYV